MNGQENIPLTEELLYVESSGIPDFTVGFVKLVEDSTPPDARLAGSGTLVVVDGTHAILTAAHVLQHLPCTGEIALVLSSQFGARWHRFTLLMQHTEKVPVAKGSVDAEGPDLGFLVPPSVVLGGIRAVKSFYNLSKRQQEVLSRPRPTDEGIWCLCGIVDEWTDEAKPWRGPDWGKTFRGILGAGKVAREYARDGYDYIEFGVKVGPGDTDPQSFKGCSGGGLWQIEMGKSGTGKVEVRGIILSGVAFYQSEAGLPIRCHGRRSIYDAAVGKVRRRPF